MLSYYSSGLIMIIMEDNNYPFNPLHAGGFCTVMWLYLLLKVTSSPFSEEAVRYNCESNEHCIVYFFSLKKNYI